MRSTAERAQVSPHAMRAGDTILAGLITGAAVGLIGAVASVPLRRWAGVSDRSLINGYYIVVGALLLWVPLGVLYAVLRSKIDAALRVTITAAAIVAVIGTIIVYTALRNFAIRCPSLAEPLLLFVTLGGAALFTVLVGRRVSAPLRMVAPAAFVATIIAGGLVTAFDHKPSVHFTLSKLPSAPATRAATAPGGATSAVAGSGNPAAASTVAGTAAAAQAAPAGPIHFVVSNESQAAFTVHEKLTRLPAPSDAVGTTQAITGDIYLVQGTGVAESPPSTFKVDLSTLTSDSPQRDNFIKRNTLQTAQFPNATYTLTGVDGFPTSYKQGDEVKVTLHGTMQVHGTDQPVDWTGTARDANGRLEAVLSTDVTMTQFGMSPPQVSVVQSVDDKVHLDLHLFADQQGG